MYTETNDNENRTTPNLWDSVRAVLRGKCIVTQVYLRKQEKYQINKLTLHLEELEKEEEEEQKNSKLVEGNKS